MTVSWQSRRDTTHLDIAVDDVGAVHVLEADEHLVQEQFHVLVGEELRGADQLVQVGVDKLENLIVQPTGGREGSRDGGQASASKRWRARWRKTSIKNQCTRV